jgi:hypothetical protein
MIKETVPVDDYLKAITGKFDLETIFTLDLPNKNITKLSSIPLCTSLMFLNLSKNKISQINGLSNLLQLMFLDLSFNLVSSIDALDSLILLKHLKLHGNNIEKISSNKMGKLVRLETLSFQIMPFKENPDLNTSNPICKGTNYRQNMFDVFNNLKFLDGTSKNNKPFESPEDDNMNDLLEKVNPDNFTFDFYKKVDYKNEELITDNDKTKAKKIIDEKYSEFQKEMQLLKARLDQID